MKRFLLLCLLLPTLAHAEINPPKGAFDSRVRVVDYNPLNVVKITSFYGVSTDIQFGPDEVIKDVALGDKTAWTAISRGNHLFIKPAATHPDTNLTVVTNKRAYQFVLVVLSRNLKDPKAYADHNLIYALMFRYPQEEAASRALVAKAEEEAKAAKALKIKLNAELIAANHGVSNKDYWVKGSPEISPTAARDNGRFIYLTFSNNRDMPAVYEVNNLGHEALINTNVIDGNTIVIQRLVKRLMLRKGDLVAEVINRSFDMNGGADNRTGTVSPNVERVIKEDQQ